jgi:hypothetical protein
MTPRAAAPVTWRGTSARFMRTTLLLGLALFAYHALVRLGSSFYPWDGSAALWLAAFVRDLLSAFAMMLCVVIADRVSSDGVRRAPYAIAIVIGVTVVAVLTPLLYSRPMRIGMLVYLQFETLLLGGAAVLIYLDRRRARAALARMHAAELARVEASKRALESKLQALQARVEPRFLFDTLAHVRRLYDEDAAIAERVLDELIAYLRAAMPRMRDTSSTVDQEIDLVRAYLAIVCVDQDAANASSIELAPGTERARIPPMMMLPLVDAVLARCPVQPGVDRRIRVAVTRKGEHLEIVVAASGAFDAAAEDEAMAALRERIEALYGSEAELVLRLTGVPGVEAMVVLPFQPLSSG